MSTADYVDSGEGRSPSDGCGRPGNAESFGVGKGDRRHFGGKESVYAFTTPDALLAAFERDIARWNSENGDA
jgi:hypothetical protein